MENLLFHVTDKWYVLAAVIGGMICAGGLAAGERGALCFGAGLVLIGIGEFINHPYVEYPTIIDGNGRVIQKRSGYPRRSHPAGLGFDGLGAILLIAGVIRLLLF